MRRPCTRCMRSYKWIKCLARDTWHKKDAYDAEARSWPCILYYSIRCLYILYAIVQYALIRGLARDAWHKKKCIWCGSYELTMYSVLFNSLFIHCICDSTLRTEKMPGGRCLAWKMAEEHSSATIKKNMLLEPISRLERFSARSIILCSRNLLRAAARQPPDNTIWCDNTMVWSGLVDQWFLSPRPYVREHMSETVSPRTWARDRVSETVCPRPCVREGESETVRPWPCVRDRISEAITKWKTINPRPWIRDRVSEKWKIHEIYVHALQIY